MNTAKVRNWHKRNTQAAHEIPVNVAVHTQTDERWEPYAQIYLRKQDGGGILTITLTPDEFIALAAQMERGVEMFKEAQP